VNPPVSILDRTFKYVPSTATSIAETWRRFGWQPTTERERQMRPRLTAEAPARDYMTRRATKERGLQDLNPGLDRR
jgi:hypothetical protein